MKFKLKHFKKESVLSLWGVKLIILFRLFLGNYANVSESKPICYLIQLYCIIFSSTVVGVYFSEIFFMDVFFISFVNVIEYILTALIFFIYGNELFKNFLYTIKINDRVMGFKNISFITNYVYLFIFFASLVKICLCIIHVTVTLRAFHGYFSVIFVDLSNDLNNFAIIFLFSIIQIRMMQLRNFLKLNLIPINIVGRNEVAISIKNVRKSLLYYNNLLDNFQTLDDQLQYLLIVIWSTRSVRMVLMTFFMTFHYNSVYFPDVIKVAFIVETILLLAMVSCPAFIVEATAHEVDQIKETLKRQLLRCSDGSLQFELETALQYVSLRPFRYTICRAVPLNVYLPFTVISFCITYVIVAMQLTHFTES